MAINRFKIISNKIGITEIEAKTISFVLVFLFVGIIAYYFKYKDSVNEQPKYNYSKQDSLFWNNSAKKNDQLENKKKVDYKQELSDFSSDKLKQVTEKIDINKATSNELVLLPGIGKKTAEKIIEHRKNNGKFRTINELLSVSGIGKKKLEKIKSLIFIN